MLERLERLDRGLAEASRLRAEGRAPALVPALAGCTACGTARLIASPAPLGRCEPCGAPLTEIR